MEALSTLDVSEWGDMAPSEKQAWLLDRALDRKREILSLPLPDKSDDSAEATRVRSLVLSAADSTIGQTIALRSSALEKAADGQARQVEALIEERRRAALLQIARMREDVDGFDSFKS